MGVEHVMKTDESMSVSGPSPDQCDPGATRGLSRQNSPQFIRRPSAGNIYGRSSCKARPQAPSESLTPPQTDSGQETGSPRRSSGIRSVNNRSSFGEVGTVLGSASRDTDTSPECFRTASSVQCLKDGHERSTSLRRSINETSPNLVVTVEPASSDEDGDQTDGHDVTDNLLSIPNCHFGQNGSRSLAGKQLDTSQMEQVRKMTTRLNLETRRPSVFTWHGQVKELLNGGGNRGTRGKKDPRWSNPGEILACLRDELFAMRQQDQELARTLISLRREIHNVKLQQSSAAHQEIIEEAMDIEEERDELAAELCDDLPDQFSPTLKNFGVTRMNINSRRFSVF